MQQFQRMVNSDELSLADTMLVPFPHDYTWSFLGMQKQNKTKKQREGRCSPSLYLSMSKRDTLRPLCSATCLS